jgi:hypothetical protein
MYTWMGMAEICKRAVADRRDPSQKSSSVAPKSGRDELHVSHDPSFPEPRPRTICFILTYTSELILTSSGVITYILSRKSSAVDHWPLSCKTSRSSGLRIITTGTVPPSANVIFAPARANCPAELLDIIHPTTFGFHLGWVDAGKAVQVLGCLEDVTLARSPTLPISTGLAGSMPGRANNQLST